MKRFNEKIVLITGGASGIGRETALQFAKEGATVVIADIDQDASAQFSEEVITRNLDIHFFYTDVSNAHDCKYLFAHVKYHFEKLHVLFNNAGIEISSPLIRMSEFEYDKQMDVNLKSVFLCSKEAIPLMKNSEEAVIINAASVASYLAWPNDAVYSATKAGVKMLTQALALECAPLGIRVNAVAPGIIDTPMTDRALASSPNIIEAKKEKGLMHPLGRLGTPHDVAKSVLFLASADASFITGAILPVDGGYLAG